VFSFHFAVESFCRCASKAGNFHLSRIRWSDESQELSEHVKANMLSNN